MAAILAACSDDATTSARTTTDAGVDAAADGTDAGTFTVGGNVTGLLGTGLVVQNNAGDDLAIAADGAFTFSTAAVSAATYAVTVKTQPTGPEQTCVVANGSGAIAEASVTNVSVTCGTNAYPVSVSATGLAGTLVLQDNNGDDLTLIADGTYAFASHVAAGNAYAVTVKTRPLNQICTITQATTTSSRTNTVAVSCVSSAWPSTEADGAFAPTADIVLAPGVHNFTTITIPAGVTVTTSGDGTLDLRASGDVTIAGTIDISGGNGGNGVASSSCNLGTVGSGGVSGAPTNGTSSANVCPDAATGGGGAAGTSVTTSRRCVAKSGANGGGAGGGICDAGGAGGGFAGGGGGY